MINLLSINEFVNLSDYKKWENDFNWKFYKHMGDYFKSQSDGDKRSNRVYYDLEVSEILDYQIPQDVKDFLAWFQYPIDNSVLGTCIDKDGRKIKIGRLLAKLGKSDLLRSWERSRSGQLKNLSNLRVVISRHPYDVMGASTGRGWTTCFNLQDKTYDGRYTYQLKSIIKQGALVAYLIRKGDENIKNPISRILIERGSPTRIHPDDKMYGTYVREFENFVQDWCDKYNKGLT
jgi:hypothetical protein